MKKILFPALAGLMMVASSTAFAQSGPWYVVFHDGTHTCTARHGISKGGEQQTLGGPYSSQSSAISALDQLGQCGGSANSSGM